MKTPFPSIRAAKRRLKFWRATVFAITIIAGLLVARLAAQIVSVGPWGGFIITGFFVSIALRILHNHAPSRWRWLGHTRPKPQTPTVAEGFEVDVPCDKCGALNIGVEAAEFSNYAARVSVFRTCGRCGNTQWWSQQDAPPRIRKRERVQEIEACCAECGYSMEGIALAEVDREQSVVVLSRRCPECGRAEFYRRRADGVTPPPPPQSVSRSAAGSAPVDA